MWSLKIANKIGFILTLILAALGLLLFYFIVMRLLSGSLSATLSQFYDLWPWMLTLSFGFGVQTALYFNLRNLTRLNTSIHSMTAANTGMSSVSMLACCAHHLSDVLPVLGLSGAAIFLAEYQLYFLGLGIVFNFLGVAYLIRLNYQITKHHG